MPHGRLVVSVLAIATFAVSGCGSNTKSTGQASVSSSVHSVSTASPSTAGTLTRAQLIAKGDEICYRANVRRKSVHLNSRADYERLVPPLAAYERAVVSEMRGLAPPASMTASWHQMVEGSQGIAYVTGYFTKYAEASTGPQAQQLDVKLSTAINELVAAAKHEGFKDCAQFQ